MAAENFRKERRDTPRSRSAARRPSSSLVMRDVTLGLVAAAVARDASARSLPGRVPTMHAARRLRTGHRSRTREPNGINRRPARRAARSARDPVSACLALASRASAPGPERLQEPADQRRELVRSLHPDQVGDVGEEHGARVHDEPDQVGTFAPGSRSSIAQWMPQRSRAAMYGSGSSCSGTRTPAPPHSPRASSSRPRTGLKPVCQPTAWSPKSAQRLLADGLLVEVDLARRAVLAADDPGPDDRPALHPLADLGRVGRDGHDDVARRDLHRPSP